MATPKQLVKTIAQATGIPEATVIQHDRNLQAVGLRSLGQRGRGQSQVSVTDAANLIIAVTASRNVKDSVSSVQEYADLPSKNHGISKDLGWVETGTVRSTLEHLLMSTDDLKSKLPSFHITFTGPHPHVTITFYHTANGEMTPKLYEFFDLKLLKSGTIDYSGDYRYTAQISQKTIWWTRHLMLGL